MPIAVIDKGLIFEYMMKMKCLAIGILFILSIPVLAQKDTAKSSIPNVSNRQGQLIMDIGAGVSKIDWIVEGIAGGPTILSESPAVSSTFDYYATNKSSIGLCVAFQNIKDEPLNGDLPMPGVTEYITRTNVGFRLLSHFGNDPGLDYYFGVRVGVSLWTDNETPNEGHYSLGFVTQNGANSGNRPSGQILFGLRINPSELLGIHIEGGIGTPYFLEAGISIILIKSKGNK
jgi:hypothetical protein